jgi:hypothetical protein
MRDGQIVKEAAGSGLAGLWQVLGGQVVGAMRYIGHIRALTPRFFLGIFERFARTPPVVCLNGSGHQGGVRKLSDQFE